MIRVDFWARAYWTAYTARRTFGDMRLPFRSTAQLQVLQDRRARAIVGHAYRSVPHYRDSMDAAGLQPGDFRGANDLSRLPLISGADLAAAPARFRSSRYSDDQTLVLRSSGTSGTVKSVHYDRGALFTGLAHGRRQRDVMAGFVGRRFGYREMVVQPSGSSSYQMRHFLEHHAWVPRRVELQRVWVPLELSFEDILAELNRFRPDVLFGCGSHLGPFFRWAFEQGRSVHHPGVVWYGADRMSRPDRSMLEKAGIPVLSTYQANEVLRLGFQCERREGFHINSDGVHVRVINARGESVGPGDSGDIVISNLINRATVLLNYRLGDVVTVSAAPCPCRRSLPTIEAIVGRSDEILVRPDGSTLRHSGPLVQDLQAVPGVVQVQLVQAGVDRIRVRARCEMGADWACVCAAFQELLGRSLGVGLVVECERVERLARERGGKVRSVIGWDGAG